MKIIKKLIGFMFGNPFYIEYHLTDEERVRLRQYLDELEAEVEREEQGSGLEE